MSPTSVLNKLNKEINAVLRQSDQGRTKSRPKRPVSYTEFLEDRMLMISVIREGVPYPLFELIQQQTPFTEEEWANLLNLSSKSLQRYKASTATFKPIHSEKIIEIAEVNQAGLEVFGNLDKFKLWLHTPNFALGNLAPIDLLKDSYGKEMVLAELVHINHGILA